MTDEDMAKAADALLAIARKIERVADNIEIQWDGMKETVTYADTPIDGVLVNQAGLIRAIAEAMKGGSDAPGA